MRVRCHKCKRVFDDAQFMYVPCPDHPPVGMPDAKYCRKHDLFSCYLCNDASQPLSAPAKSWEDNHTEGSEPTAGD